MKRFKVYNRGIILAICLLLPLAAFASGYHLAGVGAKASGMAGAYYSIADDWSAMFWNPAGLIGQENGLSIELKTIVPGVNITPNTLSATPGEYGDSYYYYRNGVEQSTVAGQNPSGALGLIHVINDDWTMGLAVYAPSAIAVEWENLWTDPPTGYGNTAEFPQKDWFSDLKVIDIHPTIAYKVSDKLSAGVGISIMYAMITLQNPQLMPSGLPMPMHHYSLMGVLEGTGMGFGANIGLLYDVTDDFHIGFNFRTAGTIALEGTMKQDVYMPAIAIDGAGASPITSAEPDATTELPIPMEIDFGASYDVNDALTLAFGLAYTSWETLDVLTIELDGLSPSGAESDDVELQMNWENTMRLNFGLNYVAIPDLLELRTGVYLDPSAIPDESVRPSITDVADKMSISLGAAYSLSKKVTLEAYWMHLTGERTVDQTTEQTFKDNVPGDWSIQTDSFGFQFNYTF